MDRNEGPALGKKGEQAHSREQVSVTVRHGRDDERDIHVGAGARAATLLERFAEERGWKAEDLQLFRGDEEEPLAEDAPIGRDQQHGQRHHVHHRGEVEVLVYYQTRQEKRGFRRNARLEAVLDWAIDKFGVDPTMAGEFELARHGVKEELPLSEHVGHLAGRERRLGLDLVRGDIANGAPA